ncbi:MAG: hypothetical protein ACOYMA_11675 [Bacteroidia bacterium]
MKKNIIIFLAFLSVMSCDNKLDINAPYKQIPVVYGFIDKNETVQYLRIEKVFQNSIETRASVAAKITDSLYLNNLKVQLIVNNDTINCVRTNNIPKDAGYFANDSNYIYQSNYYNWNADNIRLAKVNLLIRDTVNGNVFTSSCYLIGDQKIEERNITVSDDVNKKIIFRYFVNKSAYIIDAAIRLKYIESTINNPTNFKDKYYDYYVQSGNETAKYNSNNEPISEQIKSVNLLNDWRNFFSTQSTNVIRKYVGVEYVTWGAGSDFLDIQEVNKPNISFVQKRTDYTNIKGGLGIFAARTFNSQNFISVDSIGKTIINTLPQFQK